MPVELTESVCVELCPVKADDVFLPVLLVPLYSSYGLTKAVVCAILYV